MMKPAAERLAKDLDAVAFAAPQIPVVHNLTARPGVRPAQITGFIIIEQTPLCAGLSQFNMWWNMGADTTVSATGTAACYLV